MSRSEDAKSYAKQRKTDILIAARKIFVEIGYAKFSVRRVAVEMGMSLGNLQYFFPSRNELMREMLEKTLADYDSDYAKITEGLENNADNFFFIIIDYLILDSRQKETSNFFFELWALASHDSYVAERMDLIYSNHRHQLEEYIKVINPNMSHKIVALRAVQIAALIEGMMIFKGEGKIQHKEFTGLADDMKNVIRKMIMSE